MLSLGNLLLFMFIFSIVNITRLGLLFLISIFQNPPRKLEINKYETFYYLFLISYIITFIINKN